MTDTAPVRQPPDGHHWLALLTCSLAMSGCDCASDAMDLVTDNLQGEPGFTDTQIGLLDTACNIGARGPWSPVA